MERGKKESPRGALAPLYKIFPLPLQGKGVRGMGSMPRRNEI